MKEMQIALEESLKLQSHYASLLNQYDGGERMIFESTKEWIERLKKVGTISSERREKLIDITKLNIGDLVQNQGSGSAYVVNRITVGPFRVFAVREIEISNPSEWVLVGDKTMLPCGHDKSNVVYGARRNFCHVCGQSV